MSGYLKSSSLSGLLRRELSVSVGTSPVILVPANSRRRRLLVSPPKLLDNPSPQTVSRRTLYTYENPCIVGVLLNYACPSDSYFNCTNFSYGYISGTAGELRFGFTPAAGGIYTLWEVSGNVMTSCNVWGNGNEGVNWSSSNAGTNWTFLITFTVITYGPLPAPVINQRVTLSCLSPPSLDGGITLYPGNPPLYIDEYAEAIREDIYAVAAVPTVIQCIELFDP